VNAVVVYSRSRIVTWLNAVTKCSELRA